MSDRVAVTNGKVSKAVSTAEIGSTGLSISGGRVREEFHKDLRGDRAVKVFREMRDNDPIVGSILFAIDMILREVAWRTEPKDPACTECVAQAEFLWTCAEDMAATWRQFISSALSFLPYGWSFHETVYKRRGGESDDPSQNSAYDDGRIGWRKHALRAQESLFEWVFDEQGGVQAMVQSTDRGRGQPIPIEKGLLFRTTVARNNPEGRSILRNSYRPWFFKKRIEEIEAVGIERDLAGLPVAHIPSEYLDDNATADQKAVLASFKELVRDIRNDAEGGIVFPRVLDPDSGAELYKLELLSTGGRRSFDTDAIIARYDQRIAMTVLADFILLGHEAVGSKALGASKIDLFTTALASYLDEITGVLNNYAVPRLLKLNGVLREHWPSFAHDEVKEVDLGELAVYLTALSGSGVIVDPALESHLREVAGFPQPDAEPTQS